MIKSKGVNGSANVTFAIPPEVGGCCAVVCGDWNEWNAEQDPMELTADGGFTLTLALPRGRAYRFRYLLDGGRWENDWAADAYLPNVHGTDDSVVDLTTPISTRARTKTAARTTRAATTNKATSMKNVG